jgi:ubiquinone/menaquinone biosynthesis C-methylase UbiE
MNGYNKKLVDHYSKYRDNYRSTDKTVFALAKKLGIKNKSILDFGCGQGIDAKKFVILGARQVVGVDPSKAMIDLARKENHHSRIKFIKTSNEAIPVKNQDFDLVFANFVIHYITDTSRQFKELGRVLKPGGYFLAVFNCLTNNPKLVNKKVPMILGKGEQASHITIYSKSFGEIRSNLENNGFKILKFSAVPNPDATIDPSYNNIYKFRKYPRLLLAQRI